MCLETQTKMEAIQGLEGVFQPALRSVDGVRIEDIPSVAVTASTQHGAGRRHTNHDSRVKITLFVTFLLG